MVIVQDITFEGFDKAVLDPVVTLGALDVEPDDDIEMKGRCDVEGGEG